jgi:lipoate-protein ligase A
MVKRFQETLKPGKLKTVLQHGTVLLDVDVEKMFTILKVPDEKIKDKLISDVRKRVTSVKNILGKDVSFIDSAEAMKIGFEKEFNVELVKGKLTKKEIELTEMFEKSLFSTKEWNQKR